MSMMAADEVRPKTRNFYREEEYFSLNVSSGVLRNSAGVRMLTVPEELLLGLHRGLEEETGIAAPVILYKCGRWWGRQFARRHALEMRQFYDTDAGDLPLGFFLQVLRRVWALYGWGKLDLSFALREHGFIEVVVANPIYSEVVGNLGRPSEQLLAGILASLVSHMSGQELECVQTTCKSRGEQRATFLVGIRSRTDVVAAWVKQNRSHADIVHAIKANELV